MDHLYSQGLHSYTISSASARKLTYQGPQAKTGYIVRKDVDNSAPGLEILSANSVRTEVKGGVKYNIVVIRLKHDFMNADRTQKVSLESTITVRVPQAVITNDNIRAFASEVITYLYANGQTAQSAATSTADSQFVNILLGAY